MSRLLFIASLVMIVAQLLTWRLPAPAPDIEIDAPRFVSADAPWFVVTIRNGAVRDAYVRSCRRHAVLVVEHEIAGQWYVHRRPQAACPLAGNWAWLRDQRVRTRAMIQVPGRYRLMTFYATEYDGAVRRAYSPPITVVRPVLPSVTASAGASVPATR